MGQMPLPVFLSPLSATTRNNLKLRNLRSSPKAVRFERRWRTFEPLSLPPSPFPGKKEENKSRAYTLREPFTPPSLLFNRANLFFFPRPVECGITRLEHLRSYSLSLSLLTPFLSRTHARYFCASLDTVNRKTKFILRPFHGVYSVLWRPRPHAGSWRASNHTAVIFESATIFLRRIKAFVTTSL